MKRKVVGKVTSTRYPWIVEIHREGVRTITCSRCRVTAMIYRSHRRNAWLRNKFLNKHTKCKGEP